jgi:hypothetical protein
MLYSLAVSPLDVQRTAWRKERLYLAAPHQQPGSDPAKCHPCLAALCIVSYSDDKLGVDVSICIIRLKANLYRSMTLYILYCLSKNRRRACP